MDGPAGIVLPSRQQRKRAHDRMARPPFRERPPEHRQRAGAHALRPVRRHRRHHLQPVAMPGQGRHRPCRRVGVHRGRRREQPLRRGEQHHQPSGIQAGQQARRPRASLRPRPLRIPVGACRGDPHRVHRMGALKVLLRQDRQPLAHRVQRRCGVRAGAVHPGEAVDDGVQPHARAPHQLHDARGDGG